MAIGCRRCPQGGAAIDTPPDTFTTAFDPLGWCVVLLKRHSSIVRRPGRTCKHVRGSTLFHPSGCNKKCVRLIFEESLVIHAAAVTACDLCASRRALAVVEMTVVVGIRSKITIINDCTTRRQVHSHELPWWRPTAMHAFNVNTAKRGEF